MTETFDRAELIKKVFNDALELEADEREKFLSHICGSDAELRNEVESLLNSYNHVEDFLLTPAADLSALDAAGQLLETEEASVTGKRVGAYKIEREIGRGGMGAVYLAVRDDGQFQKRAAIKLLRRETENDSIVSRFHQERQILADLEHPNIARLLDGGTTENGLPYFVMEYVEGLPLSRFCETRDLSQTERLKLFRQICAAVEFAHEHSVIHRDLKPSNILVTGDGEVKLLDFGIAKQSSQNTTLSLTKTALRVMTPEYASPEQMRGEPVTKATDIYSLGVVLYELVTGNRPYNFDSKSPFEIVQAICEEEPLPPSAVIAEGRIRNAESEIIDYLSGEQSIRQNNQNINPHSAFRIPYSRDLDSIILKSLRKEPERRYLSVKEFSDDVSRLLTGLPVAAQQDTMFYRAAKFFRRYQTAILSTVSAALVFLLIGFSLNYFGNASDRTSLNQPDPKIPEKTSGTENAEAAQLYLKGQHLWNQRSVKTHRQALELFQQAVEKDPNYALAYSGLANSYGLLSVWGVLPPNEAFPKARAAAEKAIALDPSSAEGHLSMAMVFWLYEWDWQAADREFKRAVELAPNYTLAPHWYGLFLAEMGRFDEAVAAEKRALEIEPLSPPINADLARVLFYARRYEESLAQYRKTMSLNPAYVGFYPELSELYEAAEMWNEWYELNQKTGIFNPQLKQAFQIGGFKAYWRKRSELAFSSENLIWDYYLSPAHESLSTVEKDSVFKFLEESFASHEHRMIQLKVSPKFDKLRSDPRFAELLKRMNFD